MVSDFVNRAEGKYYPCEEYGKTWHSKPNTCYIEPGSKLVLHNQEENAIRITGWMRSR